MLSAVALLVLGIGRPVVISPGDYEPTSRYEEKKIEGFRILVHPEVLKHPREADGAIAELNSQLREIVRVVPAKPLGKLREVTIWVEWAVRPGGAAEFHRSAGWLKANGYNPDKLDSVEINNARNFVVWSRSAQPCMILHELAHAYHHRVLGPNHAGIAAAYRKAVESRRYESVEFVNGGKRRAYALTDDYEYFAELTEAYFGKNDFYPFVRPELETFDRDGADVVREVWADGGAAF